MVDREKLPPLSEAQLEILNVVWDCGEVTVGEVWRTLAERRDVARNTVLTMMVRLKDKGWLQHTSQGHAFVYRAAVPRQVTQKRMVGRLMDTAFAGSAEGLVMALLQGRSLSKDEAQRIRAMIDKASGSQS